MRHLRPKFSSTEGYIAYVEYINDLQAKELERLAEIIRKSWKMTPSIQETVERLKERASIARSEGILARHSYTAATALGDAVHFEEAAALIERLAGALEEVRQKSVWADASAIPRVNEIARRALSGEPTP